MAILLVVDDDPDTVTTIQTALHLVAPRLRVLGAGNAGEALALAQRERVDIVLADHRLPDLSGAEVLAWFQQRRPEAFRVLMSGHPPDDLGAAHAFLAKPFHLEGLLASLPALEAGR